MDGNRRTSTGINDAAMHIDGRKSMGLVEHRIQSTIINGQMFGMSVKFNVELAFEI